MLDAAAGGPPDLAALGAVMRRHPGPSDTRLRERSLPARRVSDEILGAGRSHLRP
jgi:hypothetical protein